MISVQKRVIRHYTLVNFYFLRTFCSVLNYQGCKKLPKDEKDKIKAAIKAKKVGDYVEFPYLEELQDF